MVALVATIFIVVVVVLAYLSGHVRTCRTDRVSVAITSYAEYPIIGRLQHTLYEVCPPFELGIRDGGEDQVP